MSWWVAVHDSGNGSAYDFAAPTRADAESVAKDTFSLLFAGPIATKALADQTVSDISGGKQPGGGGNPSPPSGGGGPTGGGQGTQVTSARALALARAGNLTEAQFNYWVQNDTPHTAANTAALAAALKRTEGSEPWVQNFLSGTDTGNPLSPKSPTGIGVQAGADAAGNLIPGVSGFFSALGQASTWERVGQVILGLILIAIGVARMTSAVSTATKIAKMAGTAAVL
jgi:hypothetical protein